MLFFLLFTIFVNFPPPKSQSRTPIIILGNHISAIKMIHFFLFSKHHSQPAIIFPAPSPEKTHFHTWVGKKRCISRGHTFDTLARSGGKTSPHTHTRNATQFFTEQLLQHQSRVKFRWGATSRSNCHIVDTSPRRI